MRFPKSIFRSSTNAVIIICVNLRNLPAGRQVCGKHFSPADRADLRRKYIKNPNKMSDGAGMDWLLTLYFYIHPFLKVSSILQLPQKLSSVHHVISYPKK